MPFENTLSLQGRLLIASPAIGDPRFERTVIYMCAHSHEGGAMGIVVNKTVDGMDFRELFEQLEISEISIDRLPIQYGGPVEETRGFVLHSAEYKPNEASTVSGDISLSASVDILKAIAAGNGPKNHIFALGYSGWAPGQLEDEIKQNGWLVVDADPELVFGPELEEKWDQALAKIGIDPGKLSSQSGSA